MSSESSQPNQRRPVLVCTQNTPSLWYLLVNCTQIEEEREVNICTITGSPCSRKTKWKIHNNTLYTQGHIQCSYTGSNSHTGSYAQVHTQGQSVITSMVRLTWSCQQHSTAWCELPPATSSRGPACLPSTAQVYTLSAR